MKNKSLGWLFYPLAIFFALAAQQAGSGYESKGEDVVGYSVLSGACLICGTMYLLFGDKRNES